MFPTILIDNEAALLPERDDAMTDETNTDQMNLLDKEIDSLVAAYLERQGLTDPFDLEPEDDEDWDDLDECFHDAECCNGRHSSRCDARFWEDHDQTILSGLSSDGSFGNLPAATPGMSWTAYKHEHKQEPFCLPDGTVIHCSSHHHRGYEDEPDLACYMDSIWTPATVAFHLGWKDYGLPYLSIEQVHVIADELLAAARAGKKVEIGCIGGHGRTGTFLAILAVLCTPEGEADAKAIIANIRQTYCSRAVETAEQEWYVAVWAAAHNGQPAPEKPKPPVKITKAPAPAVKKADPIANLKKKGKGKGKAKGGTKKVTNTRKQPNRAAGTSRYSGGRR